MNPKNSKRYLDTFLSVDLFQQKEKFRPIYAIWDDNDYGQNNGGKTLFGKGHKKYFHIFPQKV